MSVALEKIANEVLTNTEQSELGALHLAEFELHFGAILKNIEIEYCVFGGSDKPVVVIQGGISATRLVTDEIANTQGKKGWWSELVGKSKLIDLNHYRVVSINYIYGRASELIATQDQARAVKLVLEQLGVKQITAFIGSSYGGLVGQSFASLFPKSIKNLVCICCALRNSNKAIALRSIQRKILGLQHDTATELAIARSIAHLGYRGFDEIEARFDGKAKIEGQQVRFDVVDYLEHNAKKFVQRFDKEKYISLSTSIDTHDVSESQIQCEALFVAFDSDETVPLNLIKDSVKKLKRARLKIIETQYGHDGFLIEYKKLENAIRPFLENI
ncbi:MAG: alpha/beta fold hydrolase [Kangiellaceae bacterium]|nr:alpha/beta fold hydrolase [Kangiellaceae bacterium]